MSLTDRIRAGRPTRAATPLRTDDAPPERVVLSDSPHGPVAVREPAPRPQPVARWLRVREEGAYPKDLT